MEDRIHVLYIDDEPINLLLFADNFEDIFYITTAKTCAAGLEILHTDPDIQVVICDYKMPDMNGLQWIEKARARYPDKCYFLLTGFDVTPAIQEALDGGMVKKYFGKPFDLELIRTSILECR